MAQPHSSISGNPAMSSPTVLQPAAHVFREAEDLWQCQVCRGVRVCSRAVFSVGHAAKLHRIICEACGAVGHYEAPSRNGAAPTTTYNGKFRVMASSCEASGGTRAAAPLASSG